MSPLSTGAGQQKDFAMEFGKRRLPVHNDSTPAQETCVRCCGTGHVRERGNRFRCKICRGSGRVAVVTEPEPEAVANPEPAAASAA